MYKNTPSRITPFRISPLAILLYIAGAVLSILKSYAAPGQPKTNFVIILMDDMGWADISCQGGAVPTPNIDALAQEGARFTDFYAAASVCSPSRASLLTGKYPSRHGVTRVLFHGRGLAGLSHEHTTLPQHLAKQGYTNAIVGKWHLGSTPDYMPARYGFSYYYGLPYSNDMLPSVNPRNPELPLYENDRVLETNPDQTQLTKNYTEKSRAFITNNKGRPFLLYLAHSMPHIPLAVSDAFKGKSNKGLYGDVLMELDWSIGQVVQALKENGIYERTVIIITSDNGPWLAYGNHAGSAGPLREGKGTSFDGGHRVPFIIKGTPARGTITTPAVMIDLLPTLVELAGSEIPKSIDGASLVPLLANQPGAIKKLATRPIRFETAGKLEALRVGDYKYHTEHNYRIIPEPGKDGKSGKGGAATIKESVFNLRENPSEINKITDVKTLDTMKAQFDKANAL